MQKVVTVFLTSEVIRVSQATKPGIGYENPELNKYLEEGYQVKQTIPMAMGNESKYVAMTFILQK